MFLIINSAKNEINENYTIEKYLTLVEIENWLNDLSVEFKNRITITKIGLSFEKRPLLMVKITDGNDKNIKKKKAIWLDGGIHSNEWISSASLLWVINSLVRQSTSYNKLMTSRFDWYVLPVINPDGYNYSWHYDRLWRKTRSYTTTKKNISDDYICRGVDANRNWDVFFGKVNNDFNECSRNYIGSKANSEIEVKTVASYLRNIKDTIISYLTFHSYGQSFMTPFAYSLKRKARRYSLLKSIAKSMAWAASLENGRRYDYGQISQFSSPVGGSSVDYTYLKLNIEFSFGVELPDKGEFAFRLPEWQIEPTSREVLAALYVLTRRLEETV